MILIATYKMQGVFSCIYSASFIYKDIGVFINQTTNIPLSTSSIKYNFNETYKWTKRTRGMNDSL